MNLFFARPEIFLIFDNLDILDNLANFEILNILETSEIYNILDSLDFFDNLNNIDNLKSIDTFVFFDSPDISIIIYSRYFRYSRVFDSPDNLNIVVCLYNLDSHF